MARFHRFVDGATGEVTVVQFTAEEEAAEDQRIADNDAQELLESTDEFRIDAAFPQTDVARVLFEVIWTFANQIEALETGVIFDPDNPIFTRAQVKTKLKNLLP